MRDTIMSALFNRNENNPRVIARKSPHALITIEQPEQLLNDKKRQALLGKIQDMLGLSDQQYTKWAKTLINQICHYYQLLPESSLYYSHRGGLLDRALNRAEAALTLLRQIMTLPDDDHPSEAQKPWL